MIIMHICINILYMDCKKKKKKKKKKKIILFFF